MLGLRLGPVVPSCLDASGLGIGCGGGSRVACVGIVLLLLPGTVMGEGVCDMCVCLYKNKQNTLIIVYRDID